MFAFIFVGAAFIAALSAKFSAEEWSYFAVWSIMLILTRSGWKVFSWNVSFIFFLVNIGISMFNILPIVYIHSYVYKYFIVSKEYQQALNFASIAIITPIVPFIENLILIYIFMKLRKFMHNIDKYTLINASLYAITQSYVSIIFICTFGSFLIKS